MTFTLPSGWVAFRCVCCVIGAAKHFFLTSPLQHNTGTLQTKEARQKYIKSLYGASSPQFAQVKGIKFKKAIN